MQIRRFKISTAILCIAAIGCAGSLTAFSAESGGKATPPHVWAPVKNKADTEAVQPGDSIAMVCAKCKTLTVTTVTQDTKTKTKLIPGEKHLCSGCNSVITVVGSKAHNTEIIKHKCKACGENSAFCCVTKPGSGPTPGMQK